jgi:rubrerythrin
MSLTQTFQALERLETAMAGYYERLAELHAADAQASRLFARLAIEEHGHAREVALQRRLTTQVSQPNLDAVVELPEILRVLEEVGIAAGAIQKLPLEKAIALAAAFELSAAEAHLRGVLGKVDAGVSHLLTGLGRGDNDHHSRLVAFAVSRGMPVK